MKKQLLKEEMKSTELNQLTTEDTMETDGGLVSIMPIKKPFPIKIPVVKSVPRYHIY